MMLGITMWGMIFYTAVLYFIGYTHGQLDKATKLAEQAQAAIARAEK